MINDYYCVVTVAFASRLQLNSTSGALALALMNGKSHRHDNSIPKSLMSLSSGQRPGSNPHRQYDRQAGPAGGNRNIHSRRRSCCPTRVGFYEHSCATAGLRAHLRILRRRVGFGCTWDGSSLTHAIQILLNVAKVCRGSRR